MKDTVTDLLKSKKFTAALLSILAWAVGHAGLDMSPGDLAPIVVPLWLYIVGQAFADHGKERAKIESGKGGA